uniref:F-box protein At3g26010-like beta-propeller domain-containing protein n=1 Tax=Arundo donax TaxID=35708 RepID=A0A0A9AAH8_ARUDO
MSEFVATDYGSVKGVEIYSSETGAWSYSMSAWDYEEISEGSPSVFFNCLLHFVTFKFAIVAVDVEGESWWVLPMPEDIDDYNSWEPGFIGRYQGNLCYINEFDYESDMSVWVLEDYGTEEWILKHQVSIQRLTEKITTPPESIYYHLITVHPDCNWIFYIAGSDHTLMAYDMDRDEVHVIKNLGSDCWLPCIPYVPFYVESLTDGH